MGGQSKRKGQRGTGKKIEPQTLAGMFNEQTGGYDQALSIRAILKGTKIDIAMMDFLAWSPAACREMKPLYTKIRKKTPKQDKQTAYQFNPVLFQQSPQAIQSISTAFNSFQQAFTSVE